MRRHALSFTVLTTLLVVPLALAGPTAADDGWAGNSNSRARLNWCGGPGGTAAPKSEMLAFLEIQLAPGWKTYWRVPGDAGVAPTFEWAATSNVGKATVHYPAPHRLADQGGESIGYKSAVILPITIEPRDPGAPIPATLSLSYGVCKNICVPIEIELTGACHGVSPADTAAVEAVPRAPGQARATDPKLLTVSGSVAAPNAHLTFDVDFGAGSGDADLFVEAPEGLYVPLPKPAKPDASGRARFELDLAKSIDAKDLVGKSLRLTMVGSKGASEAVWIAK